MSDYEIIRDMLASNFGPDLKPYERSALERLIESAPRTKQKAQMTDQFKVSPCPLCSAPMEWIGGQTVWEHPGDECPLAMIQIPLASLDGWNARAEPKREAVDLSKNHDPALDWITSNCTAIRRDSGAMDYSLAQMIRAFEAGSFIPELKAGAEPYLITPHIERCVSAFKHGYTTVSADRMIGIALALAAERDQLEARVRDLTNGGPYATGVHNGWGRAIDAAIEVFEKHTPTHTDEVEAAYEAITAMKGTPL